MNPLPSYIINVIQNPVDVPQAVAIPQMVKNTPEYHTLGTIVESKKLNDKSFVPEKEVRLNSSGYIEPPSNSMSALINNDNGNDNDLSNENKEGLIKSFYEEYLEYNPLDNTQIMGVSCKWVKNNKQNVQKLRCFHQQYTFIPNGGSSSIKVDSGTGAGTLIFMATPPP